MFLFVNTIDVSTHAHCFRGTACAFYSLSPFIYHIIRSWYPYISRGTSCLKRPVRETLPIESVLRAYMDESMEDTRSIASTRSRNRTSDIYKTHHKNDDDNISVLSFNSAASHNTRKLSTGFYARYY